MRTVVFIALMAAVLLPAAANGAQPGNTGTANRISKHLKDSGQLKNYRIGVTYKDGVATLSGTVASPEQREAAVRLAEQVAGVSQVKCSLACPADTGLSSGEGQNEEILGAFNEAKLATAETDNQNVTHAYQQTGSAMSMQRAPMQAGRGSMPMGAPRMAARRPMPRNNMPLPARRPMMNPQIQQVSMQGVQQAGCPCPPGGMPGGMGGPGMVDCGPGGMGGAPMGFVPGASARGPSYENAQMPGYAWPSYASYPNYAALTYPQQYSPTAWPYIGPFYPYPQVPLAWRKVSLEWDDGWWFLDFSAHNSSH